MYGDYLSYVGSVIGGFQGLISRGGGMVGYWSALMVYVTSPLLFCFSDHDNKK